MVRRVHGSTVRVSTVHMDHPELGVRHRLRGRRDSLSSLPPLPIVQYLANLSENDVWMNHTGPYGVSPPYVDHILLEWELKLFVLLR
jgi:hypothetical protein